MINKLIITFVLGLFLVALFFMGGCSDQSKENVGKYLLKMFVGPLRDFPEMFGEDIR